RTRSRSLGSRYTPASAAKSAFRIVLAAPVSTRTSEISIVVFRKVSDAVTNGSSPQSWSCTDPSHPDPWPLFDVQVDHCGVGEAELALRVLAMERGVPLHRSASIAAHLDDRNLIEHAPAINRVGFQRFDHQPLIRISSTYIA